MRINVDDSWAESRYKTQVSRMLETKTKEEYLITVNKLSLITHMTKLVVDQEVFLRLRNIGSLPSREPCPERISYWRRGGCAVDQDKTQETTRMSQATSCEDIGSCSFSKADSVADMKEVQNSDQVFTECLERRKLVAGEIKQIRI